MGEFRVVSDFEPTGDQPEAIEELTYGIENGARHQTLLGVTGSGKTFTIANVIARVRKPTLIISHNKTLAAQLYGEFKGFFPDNAVEYFISYYDYYQPEAYIPQTDTYIEKDASINDDIDRLRLKATTSLLERRDVVVVASVSCIYNIGTPEEFMDKLISIDLGQNMERDDLLRSLVDLQYVRNDIDFSRGAFRVRGSVVDVHLAYEEKGVRIVFDGNTVDSLFEIDVLKGQEKERKERVLIYPAKHFLTNYPTLSRALKTIEDELEERLRHFRSTSKLLEAQRLETRTHYDLEMLKEVGYCPGIENYSRHMDGRKPGERPHCLIDYFPKDYLLIIDESHVTVPQIQGMYRGDRSRKETLVEYGFRLPSALDNRPLRFDEFESLVNQAVYVSATPAEYELKKSKGVVVEQIIRPTGLVDPKVTIKPARNQVDDLIEEIRKRVKKKANPSSAGSRMPRKKGKKLSRKRMMIQGTTILAPKKRVKFPKTTPKKKVKRSRQNVIPFWSKPSRTVWKLPWRTFPSWKATLCVCPTTLVLRGVLSKVPTALRPWPRFPIFPVS